MRLPNSIAFRSHTCQHTHDIPAHPPHRLCSTALEGTQPALRCLEDSTRQRLRHKATALRFRPCTLTPRGIPDQQHGSIQQGSMTLEPLCTAGRPPRPLHTSTQADTARLQLRQSQPGSTTRLQPGTDRQRHYHQHSMIPHCTEIRQR